MTTLSLVNLTKQYANDGFALQDINLTVENGELLALLGPSGSGKTTTLRLIAGLLTPTAGDICFDSQSVLQTPAEKRGAVMVFQEPALFPFMSVGDNIAFGLKIQKLNRAQIRHRVSEVLAAIQLPDFANRRPDTLSDGQRQRVALARALAVRPKILLLDEPFSKLEPELRENLRDMVRRLQKSFKITTLFVTHDQEEAVAVADRIALLFDGQLRQLGYAREFYEHPVDTQVARFFGGVNFIEGVKEGSIVHTAFGPIEVAPYDINGPVLLTIRPEAIEINTNDYNCLTAQITDYHYRGQVAHCCTCINDTELRVIAPPYRTFQAGEQILLHFPRERIHILPSIKASP